MERKSLVGIWLKILRSSLAGNFVNRLTPSRKIRPWCTNCDPNILMLWKRLVAAA